MQAIAMLLGMILGGAGCMGGMVGAQMRWGIRPRVLVAGALVGTFAGALGAQGIVAVLVRLGA